MSLSLSSTTREPSHGWLVVLGGHRVWLLMVGMAALAALIAVNADNATPVLAAWLMPVVWAATVDARTTRLPDRIVLPGGAVFVTALVGVAWADRDWSLLAGAMVGALVLGVPFAVVHVLFPGGFGFGDVKFGVLIGLGLGVVRPGVGVAVFVTAALLQLVVATTRPWPAQRLPGADRAAAPFGPAVATAAVGWVVVLLLLGGGA
jgi:leader peptidase (prepilin peptidase)/N-methyltransferase